MHDQARISITGRVQGVFYRDSARKKAQALSLTGYVKNMPDNSVEALVQGPRTQIEQFIAWCHEGPSSANVENVEVEWQDTENPYDKFEIIY